MANITYTIYQKCTSFSKIKLSSIFFKKSSIFLPDDVHLILEWNPSYDYKSDIMSQSIDIPYAAERLKKKPFHLCEKSYVQISS